MSSSLVNSPKLTDTPKSRRNKEIVKNIFKDHEYGLFNNYQKQQTPNYESNETQPQIQNNIMECEILIPENKYLTLKKNLLKGIWNVELPSPEWIIYRNEKSNALVYLFVEQVAHTSNKIMPVASKFVSFIL